MKNTTQGLNETFTEIIGKPQIRIFEGKPAPEKKQKCFNLLNQMQGNKYYPLALRIVKFKLKS